MFTETLPIEYYGVSSCDYPFPTVTERTIILPNNIDIKTIIKVYCNADLVINNKDTLFSNVNSCICNVTISIEYIDSSNDDTISIFSDYTYAPLHYFIDNNYSSNNLSCKISHLHLNILASNRIYIYLALSPY